MSARPLTRETSACAGWTHPLDGPQGSQGGRARSCLDSAFGATDGASTPSGRSPPSPSASWVGRTGHVGPGIGRSRGCARGLFWLQKSTRGVWSGRFTADGSSHPASCSGGEGTSEAGARRQSRAHGGKLSAIPRPRSSRVEGQGRKARPERVGSAAQAAGQARAGAGERALVEGRRPGSGEASGFDETLGEAGLAAPHGGIRPKGRSAPRRAATEDVRGHATGSARGGECRCRETPRGGALSIGAPPGPRGVAEAPVPGAQTPRQGRAGCGEAEAGGSPSSEAPPEGPPEVFDGWRIGRARGHPRKGVGPVVRSGIGQSVGCSCRNVGCRSRGDASFPSASRAEGQPEGSGRWDSLKRPSGL